MDPNKNRLHLNLGGINGGGYDTDRTYQASNSRVYPTTPSTFPQPIFPGQGSQTPVQAPNNDYLGSQFQSPSTFAGGSGYFGTSQYPQQYLQQQQVPYQGQYQQQNVQTPQPVYQQRQGGQNNNDTTNGLTHQFQNQNLGGVQRQGSPFGRQPSPNLRPRTAGTPVQQVYGSHLTPSIPASSNQSQSDEPPEKDPNKFSPNVAKRGQAIHALVESFFKENIVRARDRNVRSKELDEIFKDSKLPETQKKQHCDRTVMHEAQYLRFLRTKETTNNFTTIKIIGKGAFGEVRLVSRKSNGKIYALKSLVKTEMFKKDQLAHVRSERDILAESDSQWVVKLYTTFQDPTFLYMLMEFLPGGDLMTMLIKYEIFSEDVTRFYMAEIVLAIEAVHKLGFIHRDIKPDNILLDRGGHIKLTDFGLSTGFHKQHENSYYQQLLKAPSSRPRDRNSVSLDQINLTVSNRGQINTWRKSRRVLAYSTVGTPDYIAPEIFSNAGYSYACDWWSVGAIMFECLIGWPPFCAEEAHDTYRKIVDWRNTLYFPEEIQLSREAEHLIRSLLQDVSDRLATSTDIRAHPFFRGVSWDRLRNIRAPFEPQLTSAIDVSYFPIEEIPQVDTSAAWRSQTQALSDQHEAEMSLPFIGYTYKRFDAFRGA